MSSLTRRGFLTLAPAFVLAACASTVPFVPAGGATPETLTDAQFLAAINAVRAANGAPAWTYNKRLEDASRAQARLMAQKNTLSHDLGVKLRQRVTTAGYIGAVGENLAGGQKTLQEAIQGWMDSPGHRSTLLSTRFTEFGLAVARAPGGKLYWAMIAGGSFQAWLQ
ncbi:CAP domain-containing protein [Devosia epidermidihirudinis]|uniref:CAP domain-containing protein n=1 Tax=Devosia epidermidihirudinis TaxID=1293439 RepID=UPI000696EEE5|nr:CAP domain-containing protein [Devosia epidermidihirudinis]